MICVFLSFVAGGERVLELFGLSLASAVFLDAFVVRSLLLPSVLQHPRAAHVGAAELAEKAAAAHRDRPRSGHRSRPSRRGCEVASPNLTDSTRKETQHVSYSIKNLKEIEDSAAHSARARGSERLPRASQRPTHRC